MIKERNIVTAIDIGTTKIVAIVARILENGKVEVLGYGHEKSIGVKRGVVLNIDETVRSIKNAVKKAEAQSGLTIKSAYVGMAGQHIKSLRSSGYITRESFEEPITASEVEKLAATMNSISVDVGQEVIHIQPQSYNVDKEMGIMNPVGVAGKRLEGNFHIVIGEITAANHLKRCITKAGLSLKKIFLEPFASSAAVLTEDEKTVGVALIDIGGGTTDIAVYCDGVIQHTAVIPFGGQCVTDDIRKEFAILEHQAEKMKVNYGYAIANDKSLLNKRVTIPGIGDRPAREFEFYHIAGIIEARMSEIIELIRFELESTGLLDRLGAGIVLTGGGSMIKNLSQLMAFYLGKEVRVTAPRVLASSEINKNINSPVYSTSIGLILNGYEDKLFNKTEDEDFSTEDSSENESRKRDSSIFNIDKLTSIFSKFKGISFDVPDHEMNTKTE
ncbi:MAG: cell division protein FtsA [Salinivirgaceae bacterium]|jgi:cell division protein FtsA|nr:cell division protein FtsA [Bacteroidales bacterium]